MTQTDCCFHEGSLHGSLSFQPQPNKRETRAAQNQPLKLWIGSFIQNISYVEGTATVLVAMQRGMRAIFIIIFFLFSLLQKTVWHEMFFLAFVANVLPSRSCNWVSRSKSCFKEFTPWCWWFNKHNCLLNSSVAVSYYIWLPLFKSYLFYLLLKCS